jgi:hypothetical protein
MTRYTLKQLKEMVKTGIATDFTKATNKEYKELIANGGYTQVGFASGIYGCNGKLLKGLKDGKLYAITDRTSAIFLF